MTSRTSGLALLLSVALVVIPGSTPTSIAAQQNLRRAADIALPPISWTCPMNGVVMPDGTRHADVFEAEKGNCAICKMALVAVRLDSIWTCPIHSVIAERQGGKCPIDRRDLVQVTVGVSWTCARNPEIDQITPGTCPDGSAMVVKHTQRPHGNHNPQHGGLFFMAPDNWHHLEGTFPQPRLMRIYLYDDYTKPLPPDRMKPVQGRIIAKSGTREVSFPLSRSRDGKYLEAKVDSRTPPASIVAKIKLKADAPEYHFDFTFTEFSKETAGKVANAVDVVDSVPRATAAPAAVTLPAPVSPPADAAPGVAPDPPATSSPSQAPPAPTLSPAAPIQVAIPETVGEIVAQIVTRNRQIGELIDLGRFSEVWFPAFEAKDLALAMNAHAAQISTAQRDLLEPAIKRLLHAAWMLDAFGDVGNREQVTAAYADFRSAVAGIESLLQETR
jgi:hypothetical protein